MLIASRFNTKQCPTNICDKMASADLVLLYDEEDEKHLDETATQYTLEQRKPSKERPKHLWTTEEISELIKLWSKTPVLYDSKDVFYFNKVEREKAISNIAKKLGITINDVLGKMYSLRTYYSKQQGMIQASINRGNEEVYKPRWHWYGSLSFLCDHMRIKHGNVGQDSATSEPIRYPVDKPTSPAGTKELQDALPKPVKIPRRSTAEKGTRDEAVHSRNQQSGQDKSDDMMWAEQMGRSIQKIEDEELKEWLKLEIQQMILRTRFNKPKGSFNTEFNSFSG